MSIIYHERPGVYSDYEASSITASGSTERVVALVGQAQAQSGLYTILSYRAGMQAFGETSELGRMIKLAYQNGAGTILAYPVSEDSLDAYKTALEAIFAEKSASFCAIASSDEAVQLQFRDMLEAVSAQKGECIGLVGMQGASIDAMIARAEKINSERMVLLGPDVYLSAEETAYGGCMAAAALAGVLTDQSDPAMPLNGQVLQGLCGVASTYEDTEIDALVIGGVTVLECYGGKVSVMRGITTRTMSAETKDETFRELNTVLIIDDVIPSIRKSLRTKFARAKNNALTRNAIRNQVVVELENRITRQIIEGYENLTVSALADDPTTCLVEFSFTVVHGLNRIYLTAHINV